VVLKKSFLSLRSEKIKKVLTQKNIKRCRKEHSNRLKEKEETNTVSAKECPHRTVEECWLREERKAAKALP